MTFQDILVHIDSRTDCSKRLEAAIHVAKKHDAHLIGLYDIPRIRIPSYMNSDFPREIIDKQTKIIADASAKAGESFYQVTKMADVSSEWRAVKGTAVEHLTEHGRYSDLIVVGQYHEESLIGDSRDEIPDYVTLSSGRPVLVIPQHYRGAYIGKRVMVCWDGSQMATRALHDSLPILKRADHVSILVVKTNANHNGDGHLPGTDVAHHLARHDIQAVADHITSTELTIGDQIFARAADMSADLLVAGAYGHSRWKELALGGVTRQLLASMAVPVLMSH